MVAGVALGGAGCAAEQASDPLDLQPAPDARGDRGPSKPPIQLDMPSRGADLPTDPTTNAPAAAAAATGCPVDLAGAILCDSFEASALRGAWVPLTMGGSVHLGNKHVLTGAQSLGVSFGTLPSSGRAGLELRSPARHA